MMIISACGLPEFYDLLLPGSEMLYCCHGYSEQKKEGNMLLVIGTSKGVTIITD